MNKQSILLENLLQNFQGNKNEFVNTLSDTLSIGRDGVYRRLRGETALTLHDLGLLSQKFHFSVDQVLRTNGPDLLTQYQTIQDFNLEDYLQQMKNNFFQHTESDSFKIYFNAKELPIFYLFRFPELLAFKYFFWQQTFFKRKNIGNFDATSLSNRSIELSTEILEIYNKVPSIELWSDEILNATIKQISFFYETDQLTSGQSHSLLACVEELIDYLKDLTEKAQKPAESNGAEVTIYSNEVLIGENTLIATQASKMRTYLSQNIVSLVIIDDDAFCNHTLKTFQNTVKKSTHISGTSEKSRTKFFRDLHHKVALYSPRL